MKLKLWNVNVELNCTELDSRGWGGNEQLDQKNLCRLRSRCPISSVKYDLERMTRALSNDMGHELICANPIV